MNATDSPRIDVETFRRLADERLPFVGMLGLEIDAIDAGGVTMRAPYREDFLRPGGTIAGPIMMALADATIYALVLSRVGPVELAVTTQLSIHFLRRPPPGDLLARARMLKLGRRLAVAEAFLHAADGTDVGELSAGDALAQVTATYSIPPDVDPVRDGRG